MSQKISLEEVKKHNTSESVWMVIHNDIYDVTSFLNDHPGGPDTLLEFAGQNGTEAFEEVGHSRDAREMLVKYKIGTLPLYEQDKIIATCCSRIPKSESSEKTWRTYDGSSSSRYVQPKSEFKATSTPRVERRVQAIVVPRERRPRGPPCGPENGSSKIKWALLALAGAIVIGVVLRKYMK